VTSATLNYPFFQVLLAEEYGDLVCRIHLGLIQGALANPGPEPASLMVVASAADFARHVATWPAA
jgi:hypothetical protein